MKQQCAIFLLLFLFGAACAVPAHAADDSSAVTAIVQLSDTLQTVKADRAAAEARLAAANDSIRQLNTILNGGLILDSSKLELAMKHPQEQLYLDIVTRKAPPSAAKNWGYFRITVCILLIIAFVVAGFLLAWKNALLRDSSLMPTA